MSSSQRDPGLDILDASERLVRAAQALERATARLGTPQTTGGSREEGVTARAGGNPASKWAEAYLLGQTSALTKSVGEAGKKWMGSGVGELAEKFLGARAGGFVRGMFPKKKEAGGGDDEPAKRSDLAGQLASNIVVTSMTVHHLSVTGGGGLPGAGQTQQPGQYPQVDFRTAKQLPIAKPTGREGAAAEAGGARAAGAAAEGGAAVGGEAAAGAAAAGGPVGVAVAVIVMAAVALKKFHDVTIEAARAQQSHNFALADASAAMAGVQSRAEVAQLFRDREIGDRTAGGADKLADALNRYEEGMKETNVLLADIKNAVLSDTVKAVTAILEPINDIATAVNDFRKTAAGEAMFGKQKDPDETFINLIDEAAKEDAAARERARQAMERLRQARAGR